MTVFLILWLIAQFVAVALVWTFTVGLGRKAAPPATPPVAIVMAVKGRDPEFDEALSHLFAQDYPAYRFIFSVEAADDPALGAIAPYRAMYPERVEVVIAGEGTDEGQKTTNLIAAVSHLRPEDEILVLCDADIWPDRDWLRRLVEPLANGTADIVTGFPWLIVKDGRLASYMLTSLAASVATIPRLAVFNGAWGGSTAMTQAHFDKLDMKANWRGALSDDLQLTNIAVRSGSRIAVPREMLLRTAVHTAGFGEVIAQARRWYMLVRVHMPFAYFASVIAMTLGALGWILVIGGVLTQREDALAVFLLALPLSVLRTCARARLVYRIWGAPGIAENLSYFRVDWVVAPIAILFSALCGWSALFMHRTTWSGTTYEITGPQQVKILARRRRTAESSAKTPP
jgi:cellulose synthase/poly-beta-1,6-N-acetylglucosamine synthase-like glycosyltransferase